MNIERRLSTNMAAFAQARAGVAWSDNQRDLFVDGLAGWRLRFA